MRAFLVDEAGMILNTITVAALSDVDGAVAYIDGLSIGDNIAYTPKDTGLLLVAFQKSAQTALSATDTTFARIQEAITLGLTTAADPSVIAWIEYRKALRAEVRATVVGTLATKPATYPAGT